MWSTDTFEAYAVHVHQSFGFVPYLLFEAAVKSAHSGAKFIPSDKSFTKAKCRDKNR